MLAYFWGLDIAVNLTATDICLPFADFKLQTEAYTSTLGLLTDWLTDSSVRIVLLETWQRWKKHTLAKLLQGFRREVTWPTLHGGNSLDHVYLKGDMCIEVINHKTFYSDHCAKLVRISYYILDEKKRFAQDLYLSSSSVFQIYPF